MNRYRLKRSPARTALALTLTGALGLAPWATANATASGGQAAAPVLTIGLNTSGTNLNPALNPSGVYQLESLSYATITHATPEGAIVPGLATSWHYVGSGNTTFEFTLRPDARFSDGSPVTASAVKAWLDYFTRANGPIVSTDPVKSVTTVGDWTVVLHLTRANPDLPYLLSEVGQENVGFIASPLAVAHPASLGTATDGAGPYTVVPSQSVAGNQYTFVPNRYYYDQSAIRWSKVVVKIISSPSTMLEAIKSGQLDVAYGDITTVSLAAAAGLSVQSAPYGWDGLLILDRGPALPNGTKPDPLASLKVRQALNYALDRAAITEAIYGKYGLPTSEAPSLDGYVQNYQGYYSYDPSKAKALLSAAGYPHGLTLTTLDPTYYGTQGDPVVQAIAKYLSAVGVSLDITQEPSGTQWVAGMVSGNYSVTGFPANPLVPMITFYAGFLGPKAVLNEHGYDDPVMDQLYQEGTVSKDPATYWEAMSRRMVTEADMVPVFELNTFWYAQKDIGGVLLSQATGAPLPDEWYPR
jgi:peptide/nickel transport system substrate-binding protein